MSDLPIVKAADVAEFGEKAKADGKTIIRVNEFLCDVTGFLEQHPGGADTLTKFDGAQDASEAFTNVGHSAGAGKKMKKLAVARVEGAAAAEAAAPPAEAAAPAAAADVALAAGLPEMSFEEFQAKAAGGGTVFYIHGFVVDAASFLAKHPGGPSAIKSQIGKDATAKFDKVGHSGGAKKNAKKMAIATLSADGQAKLKDATDNAPKKGCC